MTAAEPNPRLRLSLLHALPLVAALALVLGCAGSPKATPTPAGSAAGFPIVLDDAQGAHVIIPKRPLRIVSSAPTVTEILFAIGAGDRVVAVTQQCTYPPQAQKLPRIGSYWTPSIEKTLAAAPDLVIASRGNPPDFINSLRKSGCPVFTTDPKTLSDIYHVIDLIARITDAAEGGRRVVADMRHRLDATAHAVADIPEAERPTAFIFLQVHPIWTAGSRTFQHDAILAAGGRNAAAAKRGFTAYGGESLIAADPDYLLLSTMQGDPHQMKRQVLANPTYRRLSAVRHDRLLVLDADQIMRPGPRLVEAVDAMARAFYPDRFPVSPDPTSSATSPR